MSADQRHASYFLLPFKKSEEFRGIMKLMTSEAPPSPAPKRTGRPSKGHRRLVGAHVPVAYAQKLDRMVESHMIPTKSEWIADLLMRTLDQIELDPMPGQQSLAVTTAEQPAQQKDHMSVK